MVMFGYMSYNQITSNLQICYNHVGHSYNYVTRGWSRQKTSGNFRKPPETSGNLQKPPETSGNHQKTSGNLRKPPEISGKPPEIFRKTPGNL
jgi:hypothetical protein